jgi:hypothetical protein
MRKCPATALIPPSMGCAGGGAHGVAQQGKAAWMAAARVTHAGANHFFPGPSPAGGRDKRLDACREHIRCLMYSGAPGGPR